MVTPLESILRAVTDLLAIPPESVTTLWPSTLIVAPCTGSPLSNTVTSNRFTISNTAPTPIVQLEGVPPELIVTLHELSNWIAPSTCKLYSIISF